jgi:hypothetical protein
MSKFILKEFAQLNISASIVTNKKMATLLPAIQYQLKFFKGSLLKHKTFYASVKIGNCYSIINSV